MKNQNATHPWVGTCPNGHTISMKRAPRRVRWCVTCSVDNEFDYSLIFKWTKNGEVVDMPESYDNELLEALLENDDAFENFVLTEVPAPDVVPAILVESE